VKQLFVHSEIVNQFASSSHFNQKQVLGPERDYATRFSP